MTTGVGGKLAAAMPPAIIRPRVRSSLYGSVPSSPTLRLLFHTPLPTKRRVLGNLRTRSGQKVPPREDGVRPLPVQRRQGVGAVHGGRGGPQAERPAPGAPAEGGRVAHRVRSERGRGGWWVSAAGWWMVDGGQGGGARLRVSGVVWWVVDRADGRNLVWHTFRCVPFHSRMVGVHRARFHLHGCGFPELSCANRAEGQETEEPPVSLIGCASWLYALVLSLPAGQGRGQAPIWTPTSVGCRYCAIRDSASFVRHKIFGLSGCGALVFLCCSRCVILFSVLMPVTTRVRRPERPRYYGAACARI